MEPRPADRQFLGSILLPLLLILAVGGYYLCFYSLEKPPFEDAAMILRYAQNLAAGHGFVYSPGDPPVDGATDFLFMVAVAGLNALGMRPEMAVRLLVGGAHLLAIWLVYRSVRRVPGAGTGVAALCAAYLGIGPGLAYFETYFGAPFFAVFVLLTWDQGLRLLDRGAPLSRRDALFFAVCGLLAGLTRPEGVFFTGFMLLSLLLLLPGTERKRLLLLFLLGFGLPGAVYFGWHWTHFGYALPNPFYIKGGGDLHWYSLKRSVIHVTLMTLPFWPVLLLSLRRELLGRMAALLLSVALFTGIWILMSNAMNYHMRFQYAALPVFLLTWPWIWSRGRVGGLTAAEQVRSGDRAVQGFAGSVPEARDPGGPFHRFPWLSRPAGRAITWIWAASALLYAHFSWGTIARSHEDGRKTAGLALAPFADKGYTMVISEAGNLPYFSGWRAIDAWGLNDAGIAHAPTPISTAMLDSIRPELIMYFGYFETRPGLELDPNWEAMCDSLEMYARKRHYTLAARYTEPGEIAAHDYYVRPAFADSAAIVDTLRAIPYHWPWTGALSVDVGRR